MDLHTFEPDGTHLSYQNLNGITGTLDVDDTSSYGSENYLVLSLIHISEPTRPY